MEYIQNLANGNPTIECGLRDLCEDFPHYRPEQIAAPVVTLVAGDADHTPRGDELLHALETKYPATREGEEAGFNSARFTMDFAAMVSYFRRPPYARH